MIEAIAELGDYIRKKENIEGSDCYVENKFIDIKPLIAFIELEENDEGFFLKDVTHKRYEDEDYKKLLYKKPPSSGKGYSPSIIYQDIERTLIKKIIPIFAQRYESFSEHDKRFLENIKGELEKNKEYIKEKVEQIKETDSRSSVVLSIALNGQHPRDIPILNKIFLEENQKRLGKKYHNQSCSCCGEIKDIYANGFPFKFFTLDKLGYAYMLEPSNQYKMVPICESCSVNLQIGMDYIKEHLSNKFYFMQYLLIPQFFNDIDSKILSLLTDKGDFSTGKKERQSQSFQEERIFRKIKEDLDDSLSFTLFFYTEGQQFTIHRIIEDVFPSRFNTIFNEIDKINADTYLNPKDSENYRFSFATIRHFFPKNKTSKNDDMFMGIVSSVLLAKKIDYYSLIKPILAKICDQFYKSKEAYRFNNLRENTIRALQLLRFMLNLDLLQNFKGGDRMENWIHGKKVDNINRFLEKNKDFYNSNEKIASFLMGIMVNEVLNAQKKELGSMPFLKQLKGFNLDYRELRDIFNKAYEKFEQYDILKYNQDLLGHISSYFANTSSEWKLSNVDITFYFLQGLSIANHLIFDKNETEDEKNE